MRTCTKCLKEKENTEFYKTSRVYKNPRKNTDGIATVCRECCYSASVKNRKNNKEKYAKYNREWTAKNSVRRKQIRQKYSASPRGVYRGLIKRGVKNVIISRDEFVLWYKAQEKICVYCGVPEEKVSLMNDGKHGKRLTIDRMNGDFFYEINNIVLACGLCNTFKSNIFTFEEMKEIGKIIKTKWKNIC